MTEHRFRVVASDLDGTLLGPDHRLAQRTIDALRRARRAGILVVAATGRGPTSAVELLAPYDVVDALICSNGSIVHDVVTDSTTDRFPIEPDHLDALFGDLGAAMPGLSFCWEMDDECAWDAAFDDIAVAHADLRAFGIGARPMSGTRVTKVMVRHETLVREALADALLPHLPAPLTLGCSGVEFVEITGVGVDKASALAHVIGRHGLGADDVVAFGDNHNDTQMLAWAGHGVAVGNAVDAAKAVADEVIGDHGGHSVAAFLESLL